MAQSDNKIQDKLELDLVNKHKILIVKAMIKQYEWVEPKRLIRIF